ncbi:outer membrane beta-barrel protein [Moritella sp. 36]|uniref:outer membrane beta-barrel protein n=1 Tax=Moritella sp. 36 TaxID=2746233 RepID=UPI001BABBD18|nr:outer membrane beta-barrel protein [Moritella sp. 36]QUM89982.1 outer membrane beta-barrel protein [Moritella sp. 36]
MSIKSVLSAVSLLALSPLAAAESFYHSNIELSYAEDTWTLNTENEMSEDVHFKTFIDKKSDISEVSDASAKSTDITVGLSKTFRVHEYAEIYGSVNLGVSALVARIEGQEKDKTVAILTSPVLGVTYSTSPEYEIDFNVSYDLVNLDHEVDAIQSIYNATKFKVGVKYHVNSAVTISAGYHWTVTGQDRLNLNNVVLSFRLNLEPVVMFMM